MDLLNNRSDRRHLLIRIAILVFAIFVVNLFVMKFYWYASMWYLDMIMHFVGGLWLGMLFLWFFRLHHTNYFSVIQKILLLVFLTGVGWEVFEFFVNNYWGPYTFDMRDTISDIFFDMSGGIFAVFYYLNKVINSFKQVEQ